MKAEALVREVIELDKVLHESGWMVVNSTITMRRSDAVSDTGEIVVQISPVRDNAK
jgi:hypothetical protein